MNRTMTSKKKTTSQKKAPWVKPMSKKQFDFMREILAAPSPIGLEGAMSYGVIKPTFDRIKPKSWAVQQFKGNAGIVLDTHPGDNAKPSVMPTRSAFRSAASVATEKYGLTVTRFSPALSLATK